VAILQTRVSTKAVGLYAVRELILTGSQRAFVSVRHLSIGSFHVATEKTNAGTRVATHLHNFLSALLAILRISLPSM